MELWRYYRILRRRKWLIIIGMVICIGVVSLATYFAKPMYVGRAKVMERQPTEQGVPVYGMQYALEPSTEIHLNDLGVIATSEKVLRRAAQNLFLLGISVDPEALMRTVKVEPIPQSRVLNIEAISPRPMEAKAAAEQVAHEFQVAYGDLMHEPTIKSREFIEKRIPLAQRALETCREAVRQFKEENGVVQLSQQSNVAVDRSRQFHDMLAQVEVQQVGAEAELTALKHELGGEEAWREVGRQISQNPLYNSLKADLNTAESELAGLSEVKGSEYDTVLMVEKKISDIKDKLARSVELAPEYVSKASAPNVLYDNALQRLMGVVVDYDGASARRSAIAEVVTQVDATLAKLPEKEKELAALTVDQDAAERTYTLLRSKLDEAEIKESESKNASAIKIIDEAYYTKVDPKNSLKLGLALLLSPMLSAAIVFLLYYLDNTIKTPAEAEELLGLPVFAVVPRSRSHSLVRHKRPEALFEIYQILSANLWTSLDVSKGACLVMASAEPDTGRSITASNLAVTLARDGARVILVDADFRQPVQHNIFKVENEYGLSNVLSGAALLEDVLLPTKFDGLLLMTSGPIPDNPVRLLRAPQMKTLVEQVSAVADFVVFDSPAGVAFADASIIASYVKNVVIVHAAGKAPRGAEAEFRSRLEQFGVNLIGATLNMVHPDESHGYFHYRRAYQDLLPPDGGRRGKLAAVEDAKAIASDTRSPDSAGG